MTPYVLDQLLTLHEEAGKGWKERYSGGVNKGSAVDCTLVGLAGGIKGVDTGSVFDLRLNTKKNIPFTKTSRCSDLEFHFWLCFH